MGETYSRYIDFDCSFLKLHVYAMQQRRSTFWVQSHRLNCSCVDPLGTMDMRIISAMTVNDDDDDDDDDDEEEEDDDGDDECTEMICT